MHDRATGISCHSGKRTVPKNLIEHSEYRNRRLVTNLPGSFGNEFRDAVIQCEREKEKDTERSEERARTRERESEKDREIEEETERWFPGTWRITAVKLDTHYIPIKSSRRVRHRQSDRSLCQFAVSAPRQSVGLYTRSRSRIENFGV